MTDFEYQQQLEEQQMQNYPTFAEIAAINVGEHIEKKGKFSYLSWVYAVDTLRRKDPDATWFYPEHQVWGNTVMLFCTVNAFGKSMTAQLPVLDARNNAIENPNAMQVNTGMQRCLVKAIALHGLGLYIYAGEDLPVETEQMKRAAEEELTQEAMMAVAQINACDDMKTLGEVWSSLSTAMKKKVTKAKDAKKNELEGAAQ